MYTSPLERHTHGGEILSTAIPERTNRLKALTPAQEVKSDARLCESRGPHFDSVQACGKIPKHRTALQLPCEKTLTRTGHAQDSITHRVPTGRSQVPVQGVPRTGMIQGFRR